MLIDINDLIEESENVIQEIDKKLYLIRTNRYKASNKNLETVNDFLLDIKTNLVEFIGALQKVSEEQEKIDDSSIIELLEDNEIYIDSEISEYFNLENSWLDYCVIGQ